MSETDFCYWCGFSSRNAKGHCNVCYPGSYLFSTQKAFFAHVLFVRNKSVSPEILNHIREGIEPYDIRQDRAFHLCDGFISTSRHGHVLSNDGFSVRSDISDNTCEDIVITSSSPVRNLNVQIDINKLKERLNVRRSRL